MKLREDEKAVALKIYRHLPGRDCGDDSPCGLPKCRKFAVKLLRDERKINDCPYMEDRQRQAVALLLDEYFRD
jgi:ArsR family metal-binding transcriptional regulator